MQLNLTTDYAIRSLLYLTIQKRPTTGSAVAAAMKIPLSYEMNIMAKLKKAGFVSCRRGNIGGYYLIKKPEEITLLDIVEVMEGTMRINRCLEDDRYCKRFATENCPMRNVYCAIQNVMEDSFRRVTLKSLLDEH